jgi:hypothetical protein
MMKMEQDSCDQGDQAVAHPNVRCPLLCIVVLAIAICTGCGGSHVHQTQALELVDSIKDLLVSRKNCAAIEMIAHGSSIFLYALQRLPFQGSTLCYATICYIVKYRDVVFFALFLEPGFMQNLPWETVKNRLAPGKINYHPGKTNWHEYDQSYLLF